MWPFTQKQPVNDQTLLRIISLEMSRLTELSLRQEMKLDRIERSIDVLHQKVNEVMNESLVRLQDEVSETRGVVDSAITLLNGLSAQIRQLRLEPAKLDELADSLDAQQAALAAAIAANTVPDNNPGDPLDPPV